MKNWLVILIVAGLSLSGCQKEKKAVLPPAPGCIVNPQTLGLSLRAPAPEIGLTREQFYPAAITGADTGGIGLQIDLQDESLFGTIYSGVFYFEKDRSDYLYSRFRYRWSLEHGKGIIPIHRFLGERSVTNVNHWVSEGVIAYRLNLWKKSGGKFLRLGPYDSAVRFKVVNGQFHKALTLTEGPIVNLVTSDHPDWLVVSFETDTPSVGMVELQEGGVFGDGKQSIRHEVKVEGLQPNRTYHYRVVAVSGNDTLRSPYFSVQTAPPLGAGQIAFAYTGDGRSGYGGGAREYMGVNRAVLEQIGAAVYRRGARFLLFGGDMINGFTDVTEDFVLQIKAFKQSLFGFLVQRPLYTAIGNHEALLYVFEDGSRYGLGIDRWPYSTQSVEAQFAREFVHPTNGPEPYPELPPYRENVYSFHFGNVKIIVYNNNYWWTSHRWIPKLGGCPEGYVLPNQLEWIRQQLREAEKNPRVKYVFLMAQEPVFPNGGHPKDAMWYYGDNRMRAYLAHQGKDVEAFDKGIIEVRNEFWEMVSASPKVAAVLGSDEHAYHRTLITSRTPVGLYPEDDLNGNGKLDDGKFSPNPRFKYPLWHIVSGGAGAPYYTQQKTPWSNWVKIYISHYNYLLFREVDNKMQLKVYNLTGQLLDEVDDLMAIKHQRVH